MHAGCGHDLRWFPGPFLNFHWGYYSETFRPAEGYHQVTNLTYFRQDVLMVQWWDTGVKGRELSVGHPPEIGYPSSCFIPDRLQTHCCTSLMGGSMGWPPHSLLPGFVDVVALVGPCRFFFVCFIKFFSITIYYLTPTKKNKQLLSQMLGFLPHYVFHLIPSAIEQIVGEDEA